MNIGTAHLWNLIAFAYHQTRANGRPRNGLIRQQQALLRTLPTPVSLATDCAKLWWFWRKRIHGALAQSLGIFVLAIVCGTGSIAASIFSTYVVSSANLEVLVRSPFCGHINITGANPNALSAYGAAVDSAADRYAQDCYDNGTALSSRCNIFIRPNIPLKREMVPCPFDPHMCVELQNSSNPAVALYSGLLNVNDAFGLNFPKEDHVKFRKRSTCGILPLSGYTTLINASSLPAHFFRTGHPDAADDKVILYHYMTNPSLGDWRNVTAFN